MPDHKSSSIGLVSAVAMGVGGMIGAGIFSILGVIGDISGSAAWMSFVIAGLLALACAHSFAKLGVAFPSAGGPVEFLVRGLGTNLLSGTLNIMLWAGYLLALALYASAFSGYASALFHGPDSLQPVIAVGIVAMFLLLNLLGSAAVGKAEGVIVGVKLVILLGFVAVTAFSLKPELLAPSEWKPARSIAFSVGVTFLAFEGFGLVTNAAADMKNTARTLPRAIYLSVAIAMMVYVLVALATFGSLSAKEISEASEYALAAAAKPSLGQAGFTIMSIAALFSTASAINATLFGAANISLQIAHDREMPTVFDKTLWHGGKVGLYVTAAFVALLAATVPLDTIASTGSAAFLVIYASVCVAHLRLRSKTNAALWPIVLAILGCAAVLVLLMAYLIQTDGGSVVGFIGLVAVSLIAELLYRRFRGPLKQLADPAS